MSVDIVFVIVVIIFIWLCILGAISRFKEDVAKVEERNKYNGEQLKPYLYRDLENTVEITESYFRTLTVSIGAEDDFFEYIGNIGSSPSLVRVPKSKLEEWESKYQPTKEFNENLSKVCALNNKGIALEKDGNIDEAIATYEKGILIPYKAYHSYDRLLVLYRKRKDYQNEKRVCLAAIERFPEDDKYKERLTKIEAKINKALKP